MTIDSTILNALTKPQSGATWSDGPLIRFENLGATGVASNIVHFGQGKGGLLCNLDGNEYNVDSNQWFVNAGSATVPQWHRMRVIG